MVDDSSQKKSLDPNSLLIAEHEYIAESAAQVSEDRARISTFYIITVGSLAAAILGVDDISEGKSLVNLAMVALFLVLSASGYLTIFHLVKLRLAWFDAVFAMNEIKRYYIKNAGVPAEILLWSEDPQRRFKMRSISFLLALQVSILGGMTTGAATVFLCRLIGLDNAVLTVMSIEFGAAYFVAGINIYQHELLTEDRKNADSKREARPEENPD